MAKTADIGSKRLISLAPDVWARWLTNDPAVEVLDFLSGEFQWVARATDVLLKARSPKHGTFLIANEIQFRPDARMPQRIRAYAALAEERYGLNVYPVVVNILRPKSEALIVDHVVTVATLDEVVKAVQGLTPGAGNNGFTNGQTSS